MSYYRDGRYYALDAVAEYRQYRRMGMTAQAALAAVREGMPF